MSELKAEKHYDLIVIGAGSGNSIPGPEFHDKSVAIIEKGAFGGTCLNVGCIPTKMFVYAAEVAQTVKEAGRYGVDASFNGVQWPSIVERVFKNRIDPIAESGEAYRRGPKTPNIDVYDQPAQFVGEKLISTGQGDQATVISGDTIVIAAGARPQIPEQVAESGVDYHTNETIMRLEKLPQSMIVMGGGFIALEFAHIFKSFGVDVTLVNRSPKVLRHLDADVSARITELTEKAMTTKLGVTFESFTQDDSGITATLSDGSTIHGEILLVATGRIPNGDQLNLPATGVEMEGASIKVDEFGRTTAPGIWALGDVSSPYQLKHVANAETRAVRHNILHPDDMIPMPHKNVPAGVFTQPQIATVGLTEQQARDAGHNITVKIQNYGDVAYGWAMEDTEHFAKLIADKDTGRLLGAHIIGPQAPTLIQQLITVMAFDLDVREVARDQYWIHPALPELIENALLGLEF
ncbi:MAG: mycothione reductase [Corynebacterium sp.]|uniref:mycothione reductase n=1 Tax=Corynebacterium sp. TaxID=1720 RepID=UPI0026DBDC03|nr:mycothione reductase [Corynebacterium sp.]MDO5097991.1 mycothione reductase [Corynebacterium sp.]